MIYPLVCPLLFSIQVSYSVSLESQHLTKSKKYIWMLLFAIDMHHP